MTDRELMQQALNVLKIFVDGGNSAWARKIIEIKEALRDRLAQPEQEPLPEKSKGALSHEENKRHNKKILDKFYEENAHLYTAPPQREWQGLTDEEREEATGWSVEHIEAKLKEKNT